MPRREPQPFMLEFGHRVRQLRNQLKQPSGRRMPIDRLAHNAGIDRTTLGRIELGEIVPSLETILRLAGALEVDPCDLVIGLQPPD